MSRLEKIKGNMASCTDSYVDNNEFLDDMEYLIQRLERYEAALQHIITAQDYDDYWPANIAEEALKE